MWEGDVWVATRAARAAADIVQSGFFRDVDTEMKGAVDPVTEVDRDAEEAIRSIIGSHFPDDSILGEEQGGAEWESGRVWIVDPLDGTVNFVHGLPLVAVSVALWGDGEPLVGVVIDVAANDEYVAARGHGATSNGQPIHVSETPDLADALIVTGFPYDRRERARDYLAVMEKVLERSQGTRRLGAAALDLAWVARGRIDGYWEHGGPHGIKPWDIAAGLLLITEAGGTFTDQQGELNRLDAKAHIATNGKFHEELRQIVADTMPGHL